MDNRFTPCIWPDCGRLTNDESGLCPEHRRPESALNPQAEIRLQRVEATIRMLRETGDPQFIGRLHHGLAQVREAMPDSGGEPLDDEMRTED